jgi:hypothetical protein
MLGISTLEVGRLRREVTKGAEQFTWHYYAATLGIQYATCSVRTKNRRPFVTTRFMELLVTDFIVFVKKNVRKLWRFSAQ